MAHQRASEWFTDPRILRPGGLYSTWEDRTLEAHRVERKLSAIFAADVEGYSRLMGRDEVGTLRTLTAYRVIVDRLIASHRGRIFNTAGDSILADFASAVDAVQCAVAVQDAISRENADRPADEQMRFRIGAHVGDIIVQGDNLFGDAVNIAARLEALAEPGGICVSGSAARLASYRDGALTATKFAGKGHWEKHIADELIHILDGMATLDVAGEDGPQSLALRAGMMTVIPQGTWHRFRSAEGVTLMTATPFPGETIEDDLDDPRMVESKAM